MSNLGLFEKKEKRKKTACYADTTKDMSVWATGTSWAW